MGELLDLARVKEQLSDLSQKEARINQKLGDARYRRALFEDPVKVLKQEGIALPKDHEETIVQLFKSAKVPADADLRVSSSLEPAALGIAIGIGIRIRF